MEAEPAAFFRSSDVVIHAQRLPAVYPILAIEVGFRAIFSKIILNNQNCVFARNLYVGSGPLQTFPPMTS